MGVLSPAEVNPANGYRQYRESQLEDARLIARLRKLDMPLAIVGEIVDTLPHQRTNAAMP